MMNLSTVLEASAGRFPEKEAVVDGEHRWNYRELHRAAEQVAAGLQRAGVYPGDRVALSCFTSSWFVISYFGILKCGAVVVPLNPLLRQDDLVYTLSNCGAVGWIAHEGSSALPIGEQCIAALEKTECCRNLWIIGENTSSASDSRVHSWENLVSGWISGYDTVQRNSDDTAGIIYTSGTTGRPKGAELTHSNYLMHCQVMKERMQYRFEDRLLIAVPLFHSFGQNLLMNCALTAGATLVLLPRFEPGAVLSVMETHEITYIGGVPTMMQALLDYASLHPVDLGRIRRHWTRGICGGAPVPIEILQETREVFGAELIVGYGLSESTCASTTTLFDAPFKAGSVGMPIWGCELRIVDDAMNDVAPGERGEILIRGQNVMKGYYNNPGANAESFHQGWMRSGDIGMQDADGCFQVVDRKKNMIIRGGGNVYPAEQEQALLRHPAVRQAAVVGIPDRLLGEEVYAFLVIDPESAVTPEEIICWAKSEIGLYAYPRHVLFRESLPTGPTGKILNTVLRDEIAGKRPC